MSREVKASDVTITTLEILDSQAPIYDAAQTGSRVMLELALWLVLAEQICERLHVIGYACQASNCGDVASWTSYWPGQTSRQCTRHRDYAAHIANEMGFELRSEPLPVRPYPEPDPDPTAERFAAIELD